MNDSNNVFALVLVLLLLPSFAFGYIDPGSGYLLGQFLTAAAAGSLFFLRTIVLSLWRHFGKRK